MLSVKNGGYLKIMDLNEFKARYTKFQKTYKWITISFLLLLAAQAVLFTTFALWELFPGYRILLLIGSEIILFMVICKIHERLDPLRCPHCNKSTIHKEIK